MKYDRIAVEGNIGAGKTFLARLISEIYGHELLLERFEDNDYLPKFYESGDYANELERSLLKSRTIQYINTCKSRSYKNKLVSDFLLEKSLIFGKLNCTDYQNFEKEFFELTTGVQHPDIVIYIYRPIQSLLKNIDKRGREFEKKIEPAYIERLNVTYDQFFRDFQKTTVLKILVSNDELFQNNCNQIIQSALKAVYLEQYNEICI